MMLTHPNRLTRFGFHTLQTLPATFGTEVEAVNANTYRTPHEELVEDLLTIAAHFSGK
ncbi:MAG: IS607 family transposase, partial [Candidatus Jordarchaeum sp.]